jgi:hypothetical protein
VRRLKNVLTVFNGGRKISLTHTTTFLAKPLWQIAIQISMKERPRALADQSVQQNLALQMKMGSGYTFQHTFGFITMSWLSHLKKKTKYCLLQVV